MIKNDTNQNTFAPFTQCKHHPKKKSSPTKKTNMPKEKKMFSNKWAEEWFFQKNGWCFSSPPWPLVINTKQFLHGECQGTHPKPGGILWWLGLGFLSLSVRGFNQKKTGKSPGFFGITIGSRLEKNQGHGWFYSHFPKNVWNSLCLFESWKCVPVEFRRKNSRKSCSQQKHHLEVGRFFLVKLLLASTWFPLTIGFP